MSDRRALGNLSTHQVTNQPPPLEEYNAYSEDRVLASIFEGSGSTETALVLQRFGQITGSSETLELGFLANRYPPTLKSFDRFGRRIDEIEYHPAYHQLMRLGIAHQVHSIAWSSPRPDGHRAHAALLYLLSQVEAGVCCPLAMTHAVIPALRHSPDLRAQWETKAVSAIYDPDFRPASDKSGVLFGMAMTEKQGGSDVQANTTRARRVSEQEYELTGHKWFCSAPMSDAFLTLAQTAAGLTCFLVPRWRPDGTRNPFQIQRLKDKLGNRANASSEVEFEKTWGVRLGEEGCGVASIIPMVHHTRLDASVAAVSLMRQAFVQAVHHAAHRRAFGKLLIQQPLMLNVLADLAIEVEAGELMMMRVARSFDRAGSDPSERAFNRLATAVAKYWLNKRAVLVVAEALECLGGAGYVEKSILPRLYREAPLNGIWEGSGNVICLDVLRAVESHPGALDAILAPIEELRQEKCVGESLTRLKAELGEDSANPTLGRRFTEQLALLLQAALLRQSSPEFVADAFIETRLGGQGGKSLGTLPSAVDLEKVVARAWPRIT